MLAGVITMIDRADRPTRREEITDVLSHEAAKALSSEEKADIGRWLQRRGDVLQKKISDTDAGISRADVIEAYASARWNDKTRFLWNDMRMLKRVAEHFKECSVAGQSADVIDKEDIEALVGGARVVRTPTDVTSNYPDGRIFRRTTRGELMNKGADGSISFKGGPLTLDLNNATGKGSLKFNLNNGFFSPKTDIVNYELHRDKKDGTWWGKDSEGSEMQLAVDEHSVKITTNDTDMLLTTNGGYMRTSGPDSTPFAVYIHPDGSATLVEGEKSAELATDPNGAITLLQNDGVKFVRYPSPVGVDVQMNTDKSVQIGGPSFPDTTVSPNGDLLIQERDQSDVVGKADKDGNATATLADGSVIMRDKSGTIRLIQIYGTSIVELAIDKDGALMGQANGVTVIDWKPPVIRRPK